MMNYLGQAINKPTEDFWDVSQYKELYAIGKGAYGTVYKAIEKKRKEMK